MAETVCFIITKQPDQPLIRPLSRLGALIRFADMQQGIQGLFPLRLRPDDIQTAFGHAGGMEPGSDFPVGRFVLAKGRQQGGKFRRQPDIPVFQGPVPGLPQERDIHLFVVGPVAEKMQEQNILRVLLKILQIRHKGFRYDQAEFILQDRDQDLHEGGEGIVVLFGDGDEVQRLFEGSVFPSRKQGQEMKNAGKTLEKYLSSAVDFFQ